jgi:hypothetical protein
MPAPRLSSSPAARLAKLARFVAAAVGLIVVSALVPFEIRADASKEYQVKAAFLYNFTKFVEWPQERHEAPEAPIVITVLGRSPFGEALAAAVEGRQAGGRAIVVRRAVSLEEVREAHILFVPAGEEGRFADLAGALAGSAVTTVGESDRFAAHGGMITFVHESGRVRFSINLEAAEREHLKFSAQLLRLATHVRRKS